MMSAMTYDYAGQQVLFRQAKARTVAARRFARQAGEAETLGQSGVERRQRERDAVITALILTQGAAEGYVNWIHLEAGTKVTRQDGWIRRWEKIVAAAADLGRSTDFTLGDDQRDFLMELGAWRNYLLHADAKARERLRERLTGNNNAGVSPPELLTAEFAESIIRTADQLFRWAEARTGVQAPFLDAAWIASDEC